MTVWEAFFLVMALFGCLSWGFAVLCLGYALYCDLRAYWRDKQRDKQVFVKHEANVIGFRVNTRRHPHGYTSTN